jgi:hypothetical protein
MDGAKEKRNASMWRGGQAGCGPGGSEDRTRARPDHRRCRPAAFRASDGTAHRLLGHAACE